MSSAPEVIRVRAELFRAGLSTASDAGARDGGRGWDVTLNAARPMACGSAVLVEVSLGAMADEVLLHGTVREFDHVDRKVTIALDPVGSLDYLIAVLTGARSASARAHRRIPSSIPVNWTRPTSDPDGAQVPARSRLERGTIRDISRGGAFIRDDVRAALPSVGSKVEVMLNAGPAPLTVVGVVSWVCEPVSELSASDAAPAFSSAPRTGFVTSQQTQCSARGFGVHFRPGDRETALRLLELVKRHDSGPVSAATR